MAKALTFSFKEKEKIA